MINLSTSAFYDRSSNRMGGLRSLAEDLQQQIETGSRLSRSSDDPVAAARLRQLAREEKLASTGERNADIANGDLELADNALTSVANVIFRVQELAALAANGTLGPQQRDAVATEIEGLRNNLVLLANGRDGAGHALFGGQAPGLAYDASGGTVVYIGSPTVDPVDVGEGQAVVPSLTGPEVFEFDANGAPTDLFAVLDGLAAALRAPGDQTPVARDAMNALDAGLEKVTTAQTVIGGRMAWIEVLDNRRVERGEYITDEKGAVGGTDIATTLTRLQQVMTTLEASQASFVRLSELSLFTMLR